MAYTTIDNPSEHFNTATYTGTGGSHSITGLGFQPDLNWIKNRGTTNSHNWRDSTRGVTKVLASNLSVAEFTNAGYVTSFDSDGFSLADSGGDTNASSNTYVAWNWKANGGTTSSNTDGSTTSTVQANTTAGFSVVNVPTTGSVLTAGHGLGKAPSAMFVKSRDKADYWAVYHSALGATKFLILNTTGAAGTASSLFNNTEPTSTVFTIGTENAINNSGENTIVYCFAEIKGYSKFGSYTGNGSTDGTFVYTGFKPAFVLFKDRKSVV